MPGVTTDAPIAMAAANTKTPVEIGSGAAGFSYAQAAKGRAAAANAAAAAAAAVQQQPSQAGASPSSTPKEAETSTTSNGIREATIESKPAPSFESSNGTESESADSMVKREAAESTSHASQGVESSTAPTSRKENEAALPPHLAETSWRSARTRTSNDHNKDGVERRKGKKQKKERTENTPEREKEKDKEPEKEKEEVKPEVFVAAPPPAVNIWQQRMGAQAAKAKPVEHAVANNDSSGIGAESEQATKATEPKKKNRPSTSDSVSNPASSTVAKSGPRKGTEGALKKDETRRSAPRGSRVAEVDDKSAQSPPPVEDAGSWPTPETALEEEKRKAQDKADKEEADDTNSSKPRAKNQWVTVPFTPSVTFNTPLPVRGGRGRGGGRGGRESGGRGAHTSNGSMSGDKPFAQPAPTTNSASESRERASDSNSAARATSLPPKKSNGDGSANTRDAHKAVPSGEKPKSDVSNSGSRSDARQPGSRRQSVVAQTDAGNDVAAGAEPGAPAVSDAEKSEQAKGLPIEQQISSRGSSDRRGEPTARSGEQFTGANGPGQYRERGEGRGRGQGPRGRGGHPFVSGQQPFVNGHGQQTPNGFMRQNSAPYSPPLQQTQQQYANGFAPNGQRGRNSQSRAQSIPSNSQAIYGRGYAPNMPIGMQMSPGMYDYSGQMGSFLDYSVTPMVIMQLEYYFSIDNLCKDVYLRKHMDSQGFVFLTFIGHFKRIRSLTTELEILRFACQESESIEIVTGEDGVDRVRRRDGWEKWVMPLEERDEAARIAGPAKFYRQQSYLQNQQQMGQRSGQGHQAMSPPPFSPNGAEPSFRPFISGPPMLMSNGVHGEYGHSTESPLSAAVPDFNPGLPIMNSAEYTDAEVTFTDTEVENLNLVYTQKSSGENKAKTSYHSTASRTFSNGSIDSGTIAEEAAELQKRQGEANGVQVSESSSDSFRRSQSPLSSPTKSRFSNGPPVMWMKGEKEQVPIMGATKNEMYTVVRERALLTRLESSGSADINEDMKLLFEFWSHFLVRNFNPRMYEEFRVLAMEDAQQKQHMCGFKNLIAFYDEILNGRRRTMPTTLARHYIEAVCFEAELSDKDRPAFAKLRSSWRNGALDLKSRKKIDSLLSTELKEELEK